MVEVGLWLGNMLCFMSSISVICGVGITDMLGRARVDTLCVLTGAKTIMLRKI